MIAFQRQRVALRITGADGVRGVMTPFDVQKTRIQGEIFGDWWARIPIRDPVRGSFVGAWHRPREIDLTGNDALTALGRLLPKMNPWGASTRTVRARFSRRMATTPSPSFRATTSRSGKTGSR